MVLGEVVDRRELVKEFQLRGWMLRPNTVQFLIQRLSGIDASEHQPLIAKFANSLPTPTASNKTVEVKMAEKFFEAPTLDTSSSTFSSSRKIKKKIRDLLPVSMIHYFGAFDWPRLEYTASTNNYTTVSANAQSARSLFGNSEDRAAIYADRLKQIRQRLLRSESFKPSVFESKGSNSHSNKHLTDIDGLLGSSGKKTVLGLLVQIEDGRYFLEDLNAYVPLDLSRTKTGDGLFVEGSIVLAEGEFRALDGIFCVSTLSMPEPEPKATTLSHFPHFPDLTSTRETYKKYIEDQIDQRTAKAEIEQQLKRFEKKHTETTFVMMADVHLDDARVMKQLHTMFNHYNEEYSKNAVAMPSLFVLMGNFCSKAVDLQLSKQTSSSSSCCSLAAYRQLFVDLSRLLQNFHALCANSTWIFVPGNRDLSFDGGLLMPRPALSKSLLRPIVQLIGEDRVILATNPCRLRYCTQDIVIVRDELMSKMRRHCVLPPNSLHILSGTSSSSSSSSGLLIQDEESSANEEQLMAQHLSTTLLSQGHLSPLEINVRPVYWNFDHALHLLPQPDVIVIADRYGQFAVTQADCVVTNPGSFSSDFRFVSYNPSSRTATPSKVPSPDGDDADEFEEEEEDVIEEEQNLQMTEMVEVGEDHAMQDDQLDESAAIGETDTQIDDIDEAEDESQDQVSDVDEEQVEDEENDE